MGLKISVVTPSFNQAQFLEQTLRSVLDQNYPELEYIVMDGGSTDGSVEIIRRYAPRLKYWCSERDAGQAAALAQGFKQATGEICCWLNSDDIFLPGALQAVADYFAAHPQCEALSGGAYAIDAHGVPKKMRLWGRSLGCAADYDRFRFYGQDLVFQQSVFWRRHAYEAVGGIDAKLQFIMDLDLFTRLAQRRRFDRLPRFLACMRLHDEAKTARLEAVRLAETAQFEERYEVRRCGWLVRSGKYWRYRIPALAHKLYLWLMY